MTTETPTATMDEKALRLQDRVSVSRDIARRCPAALRLGRASFEDELAGSAPHDQAIRCEPGTMGRRQRGLDGNLRRWHIAPAFSPDGVPHPEGACDKPDCPVALIAEPRRIGLPDHSELDAIGWYRHIGAFE